MGAVGAVAEVVLAETRLTAPVSARDLSVYLGLVVTQREGAAAHVAGDELVYDSAMPRDQQEREMQRAIAVELLELNSIAPTRDALAELGRALFGVAVIAHDSSSGNLAAVTG